MGACIDHSIGGGRPRARFVGRKSLERGGRLAREREEEQEQERERGGRTTGLRQRRVSLEESRRLSRVVAGQSDVGHGRDCVATPSEEGSGPSSESPVVQCARSATRHSLTLLSSDNTIDHDIDKLRPRWCASGERREK